MNHPQLAHTLADALPELAHAEPGTKFHNPQLVALNEPLAEELGLDAAWLKSDDGLQFLSGGSGGHAMAYAAHQFGQFVPLLGDGRALLLGDTAGYEIQLKGSGLTSFSRPGTDGVGAIGPMLREHLVSTFMHVVGVPTTRSLAVLSTGGTVIRQNGAVPGGIVVRVAKSHLRVGTVQYAATQSEELTRKVVTAAGFDTAEEMLRTVTRRQFDLVAHWMRLGFVHGVMNTDNVALSGETIDYGPCAFTERFDGTASFSSIDRQGRYAFGNQPNIIAWNMARLAEALYPLLGAEKVDEYVKTVQPAWDEAWAKWIGNDHDGLNAADDITTYNREHGINGEPGPIFIPRNQMLQEAIDAAELRGDYAPYNELLAAVSDPYNEKAGPEWMTRPEGQLPFVTFCGT
ncbi:protein adenylyltransferase SelO family protein [Corynebacterium afermentans]|uniref:protein adenylyltransferase SelO family protein n=1 Tax=Corynebacterium afermentans TaxID=38286 RepID=UPI002572EC56|nr:protein adenylyltransferase SelO family protein [Corynebacterium afermentans]MDC7109407.1 protein adenylyltransferase SelO family protein [Corynebacterium afermentans]